MRSAAALPCEGRTTEAANADGLRGAAQAQHAPPRDPNPEPSTQHPSTESPAQQLRAVTVSPPRLPLLVDFDQDRSLAAEQYRIVRTAILHHPVAPRVVVISSAEQGDGKSVSTANLAAAFALGAQREVLVIDADLRRSTLAALWGLEPQRGLAEVLDGECALEEALLRLEPFSKLCLLPATGPGVKRRDAAELLQSPRWDAAVATLRQRFDFVLIDAPPIGAVADYELLQAKSDGVVVVVRPDHTCRASCWKALRAVPSGKLLGVMMNAVEEWSPANRYGYYSSYERLGAAETRAPSLR
jgi:capsular exopolysaccharide synthesis family protein